MTTPIQALERIARAGLRLVTKEDRKFYASLNEQTPVYEMSTHCSSDHVFVAQMRSDSVSIASVLVGKKYPDNEPLIMSWGVHTTGSSRFSLQWLLDKALLPRHDITDEGMVAAGMSGVQQDTLREMQQTAAAAGVKCDAWITDDLTVIVSIAEWGEMTIHNKHQGIFTELSSFASEKIESSEMRRQKMQWCVDNNKVDIVMGTDREKDRAEILKRHPKATVVEVSPAYPGETMQDAIKRVLKEQGVRL
jgi:hypothetical protein